MKTFVTAALLLAATIAFAQSIQKWKTPDGKFYFGDKPPAGSALVGETEAMGTSGGGDVKPVASSPRGEQWTGSHSCGAVSIRETKTETSPSGSWQVVSGIIENTGRVRTRDVKLCAGDLCQIAAYSLEPGRSQNFWMDTSHMAKRGEFRLRVECATTK